MLTKYSGQLCFFLQPEITGLCGSEGRGSKAVEVVRELDEVCVGLEAINCVVVVVLAAIVVAVAVPGDEGAVAVDKDAVGAAGAVDVVLSSDAFVSERCERASGVRFNKLSAAGEPQKDNVRVGVQRT